MTLRNLFLHDRYEFSYSRRTPILLERETSCIESSQTMTSIVRWRESIEPAQESTTRRGNLTHPQI